MSKDTLNNFYEGKVDKSIYAYCIDFLSKKPKHVLANYYHLINCWYWVFPENEPLENKEGHKHYRIDMLQKDLFYWIENRLSKAELDNCQMANIYQGMPEEPINKYIEDNY